MIMIINTTIARENWSDTQEQLIKKPNMVIMFSKLDYGTLRETSNSN